MCNRLYGFLTIGLGLLVGHTITAPTWVYVFWIDMTSIVCVQKGVLKKLTSKRPSEEPQTWEHCFLSQVLNSDCAWDSLEELWDSSSAVGEGLLATNNIRIPWGRRVGPGTSISRAEYWYRTWALAIGISSTDRVGNHCSIKEVIGLMFFL